MLIERFLLFWVLSLILFVGFYSLLILFFNCFNMLLAILLCIGELGCHINGRKPTMHLTYLVPNYKNTNISPLIYPWIQVLR